MLENLVRNDAIEAVGADNVTDLAPVAGHNGDAILARHLRAGGIAFEADHVETALHQHRQQLRGPASEIEDAQSWRPALDQWNERIGIVVLIENPLPGEMRALLGDPFRRREGGRRLVIDLFNPFRPVSNEAAGAGPALVHQIKPTARIIERAQIRIVDVDRGAKRAMGYDLRVWDVRVHCEVSLQHNSFPP